jgi:hypothetical protein
MNYDVLVIVQLEIRVLGIINELKQKIVFEKCSWNKNMGREVMDT